jgi:3-oxoacyl-[acyl-carrier-protein] synthase-3
MQASDSSDLASFAAEKAIADLNINQEELDYIIVAHNYDVKHDAEQSDTVPVLPQELNIFLA